MKAVYVGLLGLFGGVTNHIMHLAWIHKVGPLGLFACILGYVNGLGQFVWVSVSRTLETHLGGIPLSL